VEDLRQIVDAGKAKSPSRGDRLLFSTRSHCIGSDAPVARAFISPREPRGPEAISMLCAHADKKSEELSALNGTVNGGFNFVLDQCAGLPLALAVAGQVVAEHVDLVVGLKPAAALGLLARKLQDSSNVPLLANKVYSMYDTYPSLETGLAQSLNFASDRSGFLVTDGRHSLEKMFGELCAVPKSALYALPTLRKLWRLGTDGDAYLVEDLLRSESLLVYEVRAGVVGVKIHNLVYGFYHCRSESSQQSKASPLTATGLEITVAGVTDVRDTAAIARPSHCYDVGAIVDKDKAKFLEMYCRSADAADNDVMV
jgi:hypothetical protein